MALADMLAHRYPELCKPWHLRVAQLAEVDLELLMKRVPEERMSTAARAFALAFLANSRKLIQQPQ